MGEKRELREQVERLQNAQRKREEQHQALINTIMHELIDGEFTIVTKSGNVIAAQALEVECRQDYPFAIKEYSARIILKPKH